MEDYPWWYISRRFQLLSFHNGNFNSLKFIENERFWKFRLLFSSIHSDVAIYNRISILTLTELLQKLLQLKLLFFFLNFILIFFWVETNAINIYYMQCFKF